MCARSWTLSIPLLDTMSRWGASYGVVETVAATPAAKRLLPEELWNYRDLPTLTIDWGDYGVPGLGAGWWRQLVDVIAAFPEGSKVGVYCQGGHGRTGTALSVMLSLAGIVPANADPVAFVRKVYCDQAVESRAQISYIEGITGRKVKATPAGFRALNSGYSAGYGKSIGVSQGAKSAEQSAVIFNGSGYDAEFDFDPMEDTLTYVDPEEIATDEEGNVYVYGANGEIRLIPKGKKISMGNSVSLSNWPSRAEAAAEAALKGFTSGPEPV